MAARHGGDGSLRHEVQPVNRSLKLKVSLNAFQELIDPLGLCRLHYVQLLGAISGIITSALISPTSNLGSHPPQVCENSAVRARWHPRISDFGEPFGSRPGTRRFAWMRAVGVTHRLVSP